MLSPTNFLSVLLTSPCLTFTVNALLCFPDIWGPWLKIQFGYLRIVQKQNGSSKLEVFVSLYHHFMIDWCFATQIFPYYVNSATGLWLNYYINPTNGG